jgi:hypothetical protein
VTKRKLEVRGIHDVLAEIGPSSQPDPACRLYEYLEFAKAGRVRNVLAIRALAPKLQSALGQRGEFHYILTQHDQTKELTAMLVACGVEGQPVYGADLNALDDGASLKGARKAKTMGNVFKYGGIALFLIGLPLVILAIGIPLVLAGGALWYYGRKLAGAMGHQVALIETQQHMLSTIPGVKLV